jgi:hypothetical protein
MSFWIPIVSPEKGLFAENACEMINYCEMIKTITSIDNSSFHKTSHVKRPHIK